ncbi:hypothetical protein TIFTF001_025120 [Ficus carica]|uniref:Uncharacterized protein n=1 Tax=Ficus carica TaxID=3494 RepID=A0AA88DDX0_FICCA|nr:hypothetical protein TIFTF001_025120 [Ficus carica]
MPAGRPWLRSVVGGRRWVASDGGGSPASVVGCGKVLATEKTLGGKDNVRESYKVVRLVCDGRTAETEIRARDLVNAAEDLGVAKPRPMAEGKSDTIGRRRDQRRRTWEATYAQPRAEGHVGSPWRHEIRRTTRSTSRHPQHHELTGVDDIASSPASTTLRARINVANDSVAARHFHRLAILFWFVRWVQSTEP